MGAAFNFQEEFTSATPILHNRVLMETVDLVHNIPPTATRPEKYNACMSTIENIQPSDSQSDSSDAERQQVKEVLDGLARLYFQMWIEKRRRVKSEEGNESLKK